MTAFAGSFSLYPPLVVSPTFRILGGRISLFLVGDFLQSIKFFSIEFVKLCVDVWDRQLKYLQLVTWFGYT